MMYEYDSLLKVKIYGTLVTGVMFCCVLPIWLLREAHTKEDVIFIVGLSVFASISNLVYMLIYFFQLRSIEVSNVGLAVLLGGGVWKFIEWENVSKIESQATFDIFLWQKKRTVCLRGRDVTIRVYSWINNFDNLVEEISARTANSPASTDSSEIMGPIQRWTGR